MPAMFSVLIVTAAPIGQASEAGGAFVKIDGREALTRSIELFLNRENVKQIQAVFDPEAVEDAKRRHSAHFSFSGVKVITGGPRWMDQLAAAGDKISPDVSHVIVHDAARPAVPYTDIEAVMECADTMKKPALVLTTPLRAPLLETEKSTTPRAFHPADDFVHVLTPQLFTRDCFLKMAAAKTFVGASDIAILKGSPLNVRLGGPGDVTLVKAMLNMLPKPKVKSSSPFEEAQW
jgi:2-C-methyl-D-erythritol 4-phosphate cytidylyltransferase